MSRTSNLIKAEAFEAGFKKPADRKKSKVAEPAGFHKNRQKPEKIGKNRSKIKTETHGTVETSFSCFRPILPVYRRFFRFLAGFCNGLADSNFQKVQIQFLSTYFSEI